VTYAEKLAELERLKAEIRGKAPILSGWDFSTARTEREEEEGRDLGLPEDHGFVQLMYRCYQSGKSIEQVAEDLRAIAPRRCTKFFAGGLCACRTRFALARVEFTVQRCTVRAG
jgi:hypothetical protein